MPRPPDTSLRRRTRRRRTADQAREEILAAAERRLVRGGPEALRIQAVARDVGITDAAVHHHFGSRAGLAEALMRRAGHRLKAEALEVAARWRAEGLDVAALGERIGRVYGDRGYARLSLWLGLASRPPRGSGMFRGLAEAVHASRGARAARRAPRRTPGRATAAAPPLEDSLFAVALLNVVLWAESLVTRAMLRSVGLPADLRTVTRFRRWCSALLEEHLRGPRHGPASPLTRRRNRRGGRRGA